MLPTDISNSLDLYVHERIPPGDFLLNALRNDLSAAIGSADYANTLMLREVVTYMWNYMPEACWGSREIVDKWLGIA